MVSPTFINVPNDLFVEIARHLAIEDVHSLLATCVAIHKHSESRFLWISVLRELRTQQPLPSPWFQNLSDLDLSELKLMANQVCALNENWTRKAPKIVGAVRVMDCPAASQTVAIVPGANLIILHSPWKDGNALVCVDTSFARYLHTIPVGRYLVAMSHPYEEQGTFMVAVTTGQQQGKPKDLYAIRIEYGRNKATTMRQVFHQVLPSKIYNIGLMLDAEIIGYVVREKANRTDIFLMATSMTTNVYVRCKTQMSTRLQLACHMYGKHVYIIAKRILQRKIKLFRRELLPYASLANAEITIPQVESPSHDITLADDQDCLPLSLFSCEPVYGTHAISSGVSIGQTTIQFWPASTTTNKNYPLSFPTSSLNIVLDLPLATRASVGTPCLSTGSSGNYVLALLRYEDTHELCLIHHDHQAQNVARRALYLPDFLTYQLSDVCSIGLDDHLGKVFLVMNGGALCELSYM